MAEHTPVPWWVALTWCIRPLVTLAFAGVLVYMSLNGKVAPEMIVGIANSLLAYWFGERAGASYPDQAPHDKR